MAGESKQERTEQPTGKRLDKAKDKGNVARSMDLSQVVSLFAAFFIINIAGFFIYRNLLSNMQNSLSGLLVRNFNEEAATSIFFSNLKDVFIIVSPILIGLLIVGVAGSYIQTGFRFTLEPLKPNLAKLNPIHGVKNLFSSRSVVKLLMGVAKIAATAFPAYLIIKMEAIKLQDLSGTGFAHIFVYAWQAIFSLSIKILGILFMIAILDYIYQRWQWKKDLMMTRQEVKDERKQSEGDEETKKRIRSMQRSMLIKLMMQDVPSADVVVTNPIHLAVALKYDSMTMEAPRVVAKGADLVAKRIKDIAIKHNIPIMEDKILAQAIYKTVEIGEEIPPKLYQAVAKILSYVYKLKGVA